MAESALTHTPPGLVAQHFNTDPAVVKRFCEQRPGFLPMLVVSLNVRFRGVSSTGRRNTTRWSAPAVVLEQFLH